MLAVVYDFLLLLSVTAAPIVFCYLLYLGLQISDREEPAPADFRRTNSKTSRRLQH